MRSMCLEHSENKCKYFLLSVELRSVHSMRSIFMRVSCIVNVHTLLFPNFKITYSKEKRNDFAIVAK